MASHTPSPSPGPQLGHSVISHPPQSSGRRFAGTPLPQSEEKCPRPAVFLLAASATGYPLGTPLFPPSHGRNLGPRLRRTCAEKPDTQPAPKPQPQPVRPPPSLPGGDRSASFGQARTPHPGDHRSLTQEGVKRGSGGSDRYGGRQPGRR